MGYILGWGLLALPLSTVWEKWGGNGGFTWMGLASLTIVASVGGGLEWVLYLDGAGQPYHSSQCGKPYQCEDCDKLGGNGSYTWMGLVSGTIVEVKWALWRDGEGMGVLLGWGWSAVPLQPVW